MQPHTAGDGKKKEERKSERGIDSRSTNARIMYSSVYSETDGEEEGGGRQAGGGYDDEGFSSEVLRMD